MTDEERDEEAKVRNEGDETIVVEKESRRATKSERKRHVCGSERKRKKRRSTFGRSEREGKGKGV